MAKKKMVKRKKEKGKHSSPETSGVQNLSEAYRAKNEGKGGGVMKELLGIYEKGKENSNEYKGLWDEESLAREVGEYFIYSAEHDLKPAKAGLRLWLGLSRSRYWEWENEVGTYKSNIMAKANDLMELQYIERGEMHPTFNMFLLKSSHQHSDKQEISITGNSVDKEEIGDIISKMGLNEK